MIFIYKLRNLGYNGAGYGPASGDSITDGMESSRIFDPAPAFVIGGAIGVLAGFFGYWLWREIGSGVKSLNYLGENSYHSEHDDSDGKKAAGLEATVTESLPSSIKGNPGSDITSKVAEGRKVSSDSRDQGNYGPENETYSAEAKAPEGNGAEAKSADARTSEADSPVGGYSGPSE